MKKCRTCLQEKAYDEFPPDSRSEGGYRHKCKECCKEYLKQYRRKNKDKVSAYYTKTFERRQRYYKKYVRKAENKKAHKYRKILHSYSLTREEYEKMRALQNDLCAICGRPETSNRKRVKRTLSVDHNHATGKVRGLLCTRCNLAIGYFQENTESMSKAIDYLKNHSK